MWNSLQLRTLLQGMNKLSENVIKNSMPQTELELKLQSHRSTFRHPSLGCDQRLCRQRVCMPRLSHWDTQMLVHASLMSCEWCATVACQMKSRQHCSLALVEREKRREKKKKSFLLLQTPETLKKPQSPQCICMEMSRWVTLIWRVVFQEHNRSAALHKTGPFTERHVYVSPVAALKVPEVRPHAHLLQVDIKIKVTASVEAQFKGIQRQPWGEAASQWQTQRKGSIPVQCRLFQFQSDL